MAEPGITVAIPIGPEPRAQPYLDECLDSVRRQTRPADEVLLIDDMAGLPDMGGVRVWRSPWRLGVGTAFNFGVALAANDLVFLLCDDDWLEPTCLEKCLASYEAHERRDGFYWVAAHYSGEQDGERKEGDFNSPCAWGMVTKGFWKETGGFPVEAMIAPDFMFMQVVGVHGFADRLFPVADHILYHVRIHQKTETRKSMELRTLAEHAAAASGHAVGGGLVHALTEYCVRSWVPPANWGRRD